MIPPPTASLGDTVFFDADGDGVYDAGEAGVAGVVVNLLDGSANPVLDSAGNPVTTTTDANGSYQFTGLTPGGSYQVQFVEPVGFDFTVQDAGGDDTLDSDVDPATGLSPVVTLSAGENNLSIDAGLINEPVLPATLGGTFFSDGNGNGLLDGNDGGAIGFTVNLLDGAGNPVLDSAGNPITTTTGTGGAYQFTGLTPGSYQAEFVVATPNLFFTIQDAGNDDTIDSDVDPATGLSPVVTLSAGESNLTIDAGVTRLASIVGRFYEDLNNNGIQNSGDSSVPGVTIELLDGNGSPILDSAGNPITTVTNPIGQFIFDDLPAGDYRVRGSLPANHFFTQQDVGSNDFSDSDVDSTGLSGVVTLVHGERNTTLDIGIVHYASLGDTVFFDTDGDGVQGAGESGVAGVVVNLLDGNGSPILDSAGNPFSTTTDANGNYFFSSLKPGDFRLEFIAPAGQDFTTQDAGGNDATDSDVDPTIGLSQVVTLISGENNISVDAGLIDEPVVPPPTASLLSLIHI